MNKFVGSPKEVAETIGNYQDNNDLILIPTIWCADDIIHAINEQQDHIRDSFNAMSEDEKMFTVKFIMQQIYDNFDASVGVNWEVIENCIINYFQ